MASPTQRWVLLLSMCLLLQQFSPAYTAHFRHHSVSYSKQSVKEQAQKRGVIWDTLKLVGGKALNVVTYSANVLTFTGTMLQAIYGCNITEPEIPRLFEQVCALKSQYKDLRDDIYDISWAARETQIYANDSFDHYKLTRDIMRLLNDEQVQVLRIMGPSVRLTLDGFDHNMTQFFEKMNATDEVVDATEVDTRFSTDLDIALRLSFSGLSVAVPTMKYLWKNHIKQSYVGKKIQELADRFKTKFTKPVSEAAQKAVKKVLSKGFMSRAQKFVTTKLESLIKFATPKLERAAKLIDKVKSVMKGLVKAGGAALAIWAAYETFTKCKEKLADARNSLQQMTTAVNDIKEQKKEMQKAYNLVQEAWQEVWKTATADLLMEVLKDVKSMMTDQYFSKAEDDKKEIGTLIDNYLGLKELDPKEKSTQKTLSDTQREMNQKLSVVRVTLSCYRHKVNMFGAVKADCARGDSPFPWIYKDNVESLPIEPDKRCKYRTGENYIAEDKMKEGWEEWATSNGTKYSTICLMNNEDVVEDVKDQLRQKVTDPQQIANEVIRQEKRQDSIEEIQQMVEKIREENPDIENQLPSDIIDMICRLKNRNKTPEEIADRMQFLLEEGQTLTPQMVEDLDCSNQ